MGSIVTERLIKNAMKNKLKFPKPKKVKRSTLKRKADKLFSLKIREGKVCFNCGSVKNIQCSHIVSRSYKNTRWDLDNAIPLCQGCHLYFTFRPLEWEQYIIKIRGASVLKRLKIKALNLDTNIDYEKIIARLK